MASLAKMTWAALEEEEGSGRNYRLHNTRPPGHQLVLLPTQTPTATWQSPPNAHGTCDSSRRRVQVHEQFVRAALLCTPNVTSEGDPHLCVWSCCTLGLCRVAASPRITSTQLLFSCSISCGTDIFCRWRMICIWIGLSCAVRVLAHSAPCSAFCRMYLSFQGPGIASLLRSSAPLALPSLSLSTTTTTTTHLHAPDPGSSLARCGAAHRKKKHVESHGHPLAKESSITFEM